MLKVTKVIFNLNHSFKKLKKLKVKLSKSSKKMNYAIPWDLNPLLGVSLVDYVFYVRALRMANKFFLAMCWGIFKKIIYKFVIYIP